MKLYLAVFASAVLALYVGARLNASSPSMARPLLGGMGKETAQIAADESEQWRKLIDGRRVVVTITVEPK